MARLIYSSQALSDLERLVDFVLESEPSSAQDTTALIFEALQVLENHPFMGRPAEHEFRELIISRGRTGSVALYSHEEQEDAVLILAVRHQREVGYAPGNNG